MKSQFNGNSSPSAHLADEQLVAFLDGELKAPYVEVARTHLDTCKECQVRMAFFQESSESFLGLRKIFLENARLLPEAPVSQFRERLADHAKEREAAKPSFAETWTGLVVNGWASLLRHRKPALATIVAIALVIATTVTLLDSTASAETILTRAEKYESQHRPDSNHLVQDVLRLEAIDEKTGASKLNGDILLIRDSASSAVYMKSDFHEGQPGQLTISDDHEMGALAQRAFGASTAFLSSMVLYLEKQHSFPDPSASEFRKLVAGSGTQASSTKRNGNAVEVHHPFAPGHSSGIREAVLFVNRTDYSPLRLSLFTGAQDAGQEYRFTRTDFSMKDRTPQLAELFHTQPIVASPASVDLHTLSALPAPVPFDYAHSRAVEAEVAAAQALHQANACLGEEIYVFPMSDGSVWVQGLVDKKERREAIKQALSRLSTPVKTEIYTPDEMKTGARLFAAPDTPTDGSGNATDKLTSVRIADLSIAQTAYHDELYNYYVKAGKTPEEAEKQVTAFSNELSRLSQWTLLNAWSVKKLKQEFSPARVDEISSQAQDSIARMRNDHLQQVRNSAREQTELLTPLLKNLATNGSGAVSGTEDTEPLLKLSEEQNRLVRLLLTTPQQSTEKETTLSQLADILRQLSQ
jgi:hypothetical protein